MDALNSRPGGADPELLRMMRSPYRQRAPMASVGSVVACKVDASYGAIGVGDLLTTSPTPGHAMISYDKEPGTIVAKAIEALGAGRGTIRVLVMLR